MHILVMFQFTKFLEDTNADLNQLEKEERQTLLFFIFLQQNINFLDSKAQMLWCLCKQTCISKLSEFIRNWRKRMLALVTI